MYATNKTGRIIKIDVLFKVYFLTSGNGSSCSSVCSS